MTPGDDRSCTARDAAERLDALGPRGLAGLPVLVGFDGFVDVIIDVVDRRFSMGDNDYERLPTIGSFARRVGAAAGKSANIELIARERRFGGNGPLLAGALGRLGASVTFIGAVGKAESPREVDPLFIPFAQRCREVYSVAPPAHTDAFEFDDGKLMFGQTRNVQGVTWQRIVDAVGFDRVQRLVASTRLLGMVNWSLCGGVESIWRGLAETVLPNIERERRPRVYVDLSDPAKRTDEDIARAISMLGDINALTPVTLGLNLSEAERLARVLGGTPDAAPNASDDPLRSLAACVRDRSGLDTIVVHARHGAACSARGHDPAGFVGPFTSRPVLSTGAGDHFNAGFALAQILGLSPAACLAVGCGVSGAYVRDGQSPTLERLVGFLRDLPKPESQDGEET